MLRLSGGTLCIAIMAASVFAADSKAAEYKLSGENTKIGFQGTKPDGSKHSGSFPKLSGTFELGDDVTKGKIIVKIDVEGLESDNPDLTKHLKSADFFETKKYPEAKFESKSIKTSKDGFTVTGDLTMHGKTKEIAFPAKISPAGGATLSSEFKINRSDWGINFGEGKIDEAVKLTISVKAK